MSISYGIDRALNKSPQHWKEKTRKPTFLEDNLEPSFIINTVTWKRWCYSNFKEKKKCFS